MIDGETQMPFRAVKVHPDPGLRFGGLLECARRTSSYLEGFGAESRWDRRRQAQVRCRPGAAGCDPGDAEAAERRDGI